VPFLINSSVSTSGGGLTSIIDQIRQRRYYFLRGGAVFPLGGNPNVKVNPSILLRTQEGQPVSLDLNYAFIFYDAFSVGASWRSGDAFITFINLKLSEKVYFAYSYDWTSSALNHFSNGSHEFLINFRTRIRGVHKNVECPGYYDYR
jgi:type IX secretion system PorP/SprF family membrane protein